MSSTDAESKLIDICKLSWDGYDSRLPPDLQWPKKWPTLRKKSTQLPTIMCHYSMLCRQVMNAPAVDLSHPATFRSQPEDAPITPGKPALTYSRSLITPESSRGDSTLHIVEKEHSPRGLRQALTAAAAAVIRVRPSATDTQQQQCSSSSDRLSEASSVATASSKSLRETHSKATITSDAATQQESRACASISSIQREDEGTPVVSYEGAAVPEAATGAAVPPATSGQRQEESAKDDKHISLNQQAVLELMRFHDQAVEVGRELARSRSSVDSLSKRCQELEVSR